MTTPERTVDEIVGELRPVIRDYREMPIEPNIWIHITAVRETLQAERQKRDEMVESNLITAFGMMSENMQRQALGESMAYTEEDFEALTQPNNTK